MNCGKCNLSSPSQASFCASCGNNFRRTSQQENELRASHEGHRAESVAKWQEITDTKDKNSLYCVGAGLVLALAGWFIFSVWGVFGAIALAGLGCYLVTRFHSDDYYSIPHSRDSNGDHRCVLCGNKGIYRQGEYKTQNTHSSCTKCKTHLYTN